MRSFLNIYRVIDYDMIRHVFKNNHQMSLVSQAAWTIGPSRINWRNGWNQRQEEGRELGKVLVDLWDSDGNLSAKHVELHGSHGHPWPKVSQFTSMKKTSRCSYQRYRDFQFATFNNQRASLLGGFKHEMMIPAQFAVVQAGETTKTWEWKRCFANYGSSGDFLLQRC